VEVSTSRNISYLCAENKCVVLRRDIKSSLVYRFVNFNHYYLVDLLFSVIDRSKPFYNMGSIGNAWRELDVAVIGGGIGKSNHTPNTKHLLI
jgi:hypothetical protein